jgi:hypothetical protein
MTTAESISSRRDHSSSLMSSDEGVGGVCAPPPPETNRSEGPRTRGTTSSENLPAGARYLLAKASKPKIATPNPSSLRPQVQQNKDAYNAAIYSKTEKFPGGSVTTEIGSVKGDIGTHNPDGSQGIYMSFQANAVQSEWTFGEGAEHGTIGLSAGVGFELGIGTRDIDQDGLKEHCHKISVGPLTVGQCIEEETAEVQARGRSGPTSGAEGARGY